jgi:hypothetical protein
MRSDAQVLVYAMLNTHVDPNWEASSDAPRHVLSALFLQACVAAGVGSSWFLPVLLPA